MFVVLFAVAMLVIWVLAGCGNTPLLKQGPSLCAATAAQFSALRNFNANPACFSMV
jgi:hypothetical protein